MAKGVDPEREREFKDKGLSKAQEVDLASEMEVWATREVTVDQLEKLALFLALQILGRHRGDVLLVVIVLTRRP